MFERKSSGMNRFSHSESGVAREHLVAIAVRLSTGLGQLIVCGTVVAGLVSIGSSVLTHTVVDSAAAARGNGRPLQVVESVAISPEGTILAACGCNDMVRIWDISRPGECPSLEPVVLPHNTERHAVAFSPDGSLLGAAGAGR